jgi:hypothetical protein
MVRPSVDMLLASDNLADSREAVKGASYTQFNLNLCPMAGLVNLIASIRVSLQQDTSAYELASRSFARANHFLKLAAFLVRKSYDILLRSVCNCV